MPQHVGTMRLPCLHRLFAAGVAAIARSSRFEHALLVGLRARVRGARGRARSRLWTLPLLRADPHAAAQRPVLQLRSANRAARLPSRPPSETSAGSSSLRPPFVLRSRCSCASRLELRLNAMRQAPAAPAAPPASTHRQRCGPGTGLCGSHALRVCDALVAQLNALARPWSARLQNFVRARGIAHRVDIDNRLQLALVLVVGGRGGNHAGLNDTARRRRRCTAKDPWPQRRAYRSVFCQPATAPDAGNGSTGFFLHPTPATTTAIAITAIAMTSPIFGPNILNDLSLLPC